MTTTVYSLTDILTKKRSPAVNKNYMSIGVSVRTTKFAVRNNGIGVRQESNLQPPTAYSSVRYPLKRQCNKTIKDNIELK